jgi:CubicO group peptidase (beta-lactamase class C family)
VAVEAGVVALDDPVASILPAASTDSRYGDVRLKHLLSHTSGLDRDPNALAFSPGTGFLYSNLGFRWLGEVIAAKTHMRFEDYLRLKVLGPSGMASTARYELTAVSPDLTFGYTLQSVEDGSAADVPSWHPNPYLHTIPGGAMGGLYSTGPDVIRFASALMAGRLVSPATLELMKSAKAELGAPSYGFGVMRERTPGVWGHGGDLPGVDAALEFYSDGYVVVVLANMDTVAAPILQKTRLAFHDVSRVG